MEKLFFQVNIGKIIALKMIKVLKRFLEFGQNYWTPVFSVKRRKEFIKRFRILWQYA